MNPTSTEPAQTHSSTLQGHFSCFLNFLCVYNAEMRCYSGNQKWGHIYNVVIGERGVFNNRAVVDYII